MTFAAETVVPADRTRQEIEKTLARYGADHFGYGTGPDRAVVMFQAHGRQIRFVLPLAWPPASNEKQQAQFIRTRWRCLLLSIKAKLEAVESGLSQFETEFLPYTVLPNGQTVADHALPFVREAYESKTIPPLLGFAGGAS
jgi:hypothetical protein